MPIQGTSAEILKLAMIELDAHIRRHNIPAAITLQIHDELLIEVATEALEEFAGQVAQIMKWGLQAQGPAKNRRRRRPELGRYQVAGARLKVDFGLVARFGRTPGRLG